MSKVPEWFLFNVKDKRLRRLIRKVWQQLPKHDRYHLREMVETISDSMQMKEHVLGSAGMIDVVGGMSGVNVGDDSAHGVKLAHCKKSNPMLRVSLLSHTNSRMLSCAIL